MFVEISCVVVGSIVSQGVLGQACLVWQLMKKQAITISVYFHGSFGSAVDERTNNSNI